MERFAYKRKHTARRRSYSGRTSSERQRTSPLLVCFGLLLFAVAINYIFPHFSKAVGDKVSTFVDYRTAFAVIGEGLTGERKLTEAFGDAWTIAFRGSADDTQETLGELTAEEPPHEDTGAAAEASHGETFSDAVIAAFIESQRDYPEYMTPAGADYGIY